MDFEAKNYEHLIGKLPGFSATQLEQHLELYAGYVKRLNLMRAELARIPFTMRKEQANFSWGTYSELKRREAVPYNAMRLHELYFDALHRTDGEPRGDLEKAIIASFGSVANWKLDLAACAEGATNGWVLLTRDRHDGLLQHNQVFEHSDQVMIDQDILLAFDVWEHAFMIDFGIDKEAYLDAFLPSVSWKIVAGRHAEAVRSGSHANQLGTAA